MIHTRNTLKPNHHLKLGDTVYTIEEIIGSGGSCIVYKAAYGDKLSTDRKHHVLIKELFPMYRNDLIYRDESNNIVCLNDAEDYFEFSKRRFKQGNNINLELLAEFPTGISGNLNSYEAYGTYYSVLTIHGGKTLQDKINNNEIQTLQDAVNITKMILKSLKHFHSDNILHLDISPDNILVTDNYALLIDYNSSWQTELKDKGYFVFSEKEGYTPPEIRLKHTDEINSSSDLYSVCAVLFAMITESTLTDELMDSRRLKEYLSSSAPKLSDELNSTRVKAMRILTKGLHPLGRKRYQSIDELESELTELSLRAEQKGVSKSALWEISAAERIKTCNETNRYLRQNIRTDTVINMRMLCEKLIEGENFLLTGTGGMGKTRLLHELWKTGTKAYSEEAPLIIYIPLKGYQSNTGETNYIYRYLSSYITFSPKHNKTEDVIHEIHRIFTNKGNNIILLLDGLNEAGKRIEHLLKEIENLSTLSNIGILLTDRTDDIMEVALRHFTKAQLELLDTDTVETELMRRGVLIPTEDKMCSLLSNPMMLELYIKANKLNDSNNTEEQLSFSDAHDMIRCYIDQIVIHQQRIYTGDIKLQTGNEFIIRQLLPAIALAMKKKGSNVLTAKEITNVVKMNFTALQKRSFGRKFPQYLGKTRYILENISNENEWLDFAVREILIDEVGLMSKCSPDGYTIIHDNFIDTLAMDAQNIDAFCKSMKRERYIKISAIALILAIITAFGFYYVNVITDKNQLSYTEDEERTIKRLVSSIDNNILSITVSYTNQTEIIENTQSYAVLTNDSTANKKLSSFIEGKINSENFIPMELNESLLNDVLKINPDFPEENIRLIYKLPEMFRYAETQLASEMNLMLTAPDTRHRYYDDRKGIADAYSQYLNALKNLLHWEYASIMVPMTDELRDDTLKITASGGVFEGFSNTNSQGLDPQIITNGIEEAKKQLNDAIGYLKQNHYKAEMELIK